MQLPSERRRRSVDRWKEGEAPQDAVAERIQAKRIAQEQRQQARREACEAKPSIKGPVMEELTQAKNVSRNVGLISMAIKKRWDVSEEHRQAIPEVLGDLVVNNKAKTRDRIAAARTLVGMEGQNQRDDHKQIDKEHPDLHSHSHEVSQASVVKSLIEDEPDYIEYQRQRAIQEDSDAGHAG